MRYAGHNIIEPDFDPAQVSLMSRLDQVVFVIWNGGFEEVTAAIFVTELRKAGLRVKIIGLNAQRISGVHGLALLPDWTLGEALSRAVQALCVIIPEPLTDFGRYKANPRLSDFMAQAQAGGAIFVLNSSNASLLADLELGPAAKLMVYPESEKLVEFARELARLLVSLGG